MRLRVTLRKSGAYITQISASEDKLYLRCFQEHRHAEWAALSLNTSLMKEMSDCNLARLFHRQRTDTHALSPFTFSSKDFGRWRRLCLARSFPTLKKATPPQFNEGKPQQQYSNDWIVYNIIPPPSWTGPLCSLQAELLPPQSKGGERKQARLSNANSIMTSHGGKRIQGSLWSGCAAGGFSATVSLQEGFCRTRDPEQAPSSSS